MPVLNLRNVPEKLMRDLKAAAALAGQDFHPFCLTLLEEALLVRRANRISTPAVTIHPPIETLLPATRDALLETGRAAVSHYRDVMMDSASPPLPEETPEIEIT